MEYSERQFEYMRHTISKIIERVKLKKKTPWGTRISQFIIIQCTNSYIFTLIMRIPEISIYNRYIDLIKCEYMKNVYNV